MVYDPGDEPGAWWTGVGPDVLVHSESVHSGQTVLGGNLGFDDRGEGVPRGVPGDPEHVRQGRDRDVVGT